MSHQLAKHTRLVAAARRQHGLSIVELMVGVAVGLFVVAAATTVTVTQITENRRLMLETQLHQDLRAASDIVSRELRRAGFWFDAATNVWVSDTSAPANNPRRAMLPNAGPVTSDWVEFSYDRAPTINGPYGFEYADGNKLRSVISAGVFQELTDSNTMRITGFSIVRSNEESVQLPCPKLCLDTTSNCWPTVNIRDYVVNISGAARSDSAITRSISSSVRVRNDIVVFRVGAGPNPKACPA